ncbi:MAG TPA: hypothetical protein VFC40_05445 [Syntrophomonas sp.]|nr:hypothetical protein [Syntrophomonas sp.]
MDLIGQAVVHQTFGEGIVINQTENVLTVSFKHEEKKFVYPNAFEGFLKAKDAKVDKVIKKELIAMDNEMIRTQKEPKDLAEPVREKPLVETEVPVKVPKKRKKKEA